MKLLKQLLLIIALMPTMANAAAPDGKQVIGHITLQGGSESAVKWSAPATNGYKVHVFVPKNGVASNALYRIYPKGKRAGSTDCLSTDAEFPCYEVAIDQTTRQRTWTQLTLNDDPETQWEFVKNEGFVTAVADNLDAAEILNLSALVRFESPVIEIGKFYQGGIVFYVDDTGKHGLIAAPSDQAAVRWYRGAYVTTGAYGTAVGTGLDNTNKIIAAQGTTTRYAARLAAHLDANGYNDWFLPSKDELDLMFKNIGPGAVGSLKNIGEFNGTIYWTSSEDGSRFAWYEWFKSSDYECCSGGTQLSGEKYLSFSVRAIRAF